MTTSHLEGSANVYVSKYGDKSQYDYFNPQEIVRYVQPNVIALYKKDFFYIISRAIGTSFNSGVGPAEDNNGNQYLPGALELANGWKLRIENVDYDITDIGNLYPAYSDTPYLSGADESYVYLQTSPRLAGFGESDSRIVNVGFIIEDETRLQDYPYHFDGYNREGFSSDGFDRRGFNSNGLDIDNNSGISINADKAVAGEVLSIDEETSIEN